ncbi:MULTISPECIES: hypothetical protein [Streptomyces]|uniref:hypothetical protein n=1 Tax=Streptomyces TaxID=1883 RepID=UPI0006EBA071|nr:MULTISPECIES: hypothetical protein [Streptomyces]
MPTTSDRHRRRRLGPCALLLGAALSLTLTGCGDERPGTVGEAAPGAATSPASPSAPSTPSTSSSTGPGASPYVEPGAVDGAPHNGDNNAYRRPGEMSAADAEAAQAEVARMDPVLKRLWKGKKWDPESVRAALTEKLGYEVRRVTTQGKLLGGELDVREMYSRYENNEYVTPEGAMIGLHVGKSACVTAFVQKSDYGVKANGPFMETGCIEPPVGH